MAREIFALWYGGSSYAFGDLRENLEAFPSLKSAALSLEVRRDSNGQRRCHFPFVNQPQQWSYCPVVGDDSEMWIYFSDPSDSSDPYPDRIIKFGPRGGVRVECA